MYVSAATMLGVEVTKPEEDTYTEIGTQSAYTGPTHKPRSTNCGGV
jgi:hypothetical protein